MAYPFRSLRDWISFLEEKGDIAQNRESITVDGDMVVLSRRTASTDGPALLHSNIDGYPGWRAYSDGLTARRRQLWALNIEASKPAEFIAQKIAKSTPVKPETVESGPCKEIKLLGDEVDLTKLPVSFTGEYETTPHLTAGISFVRDPNTGWTNAGIRRFQIMGKNLLTDLVLPFQQEGQIFSRWKEKKKPMPIAIVIGADPIVYIACNMPAPEQFDEMDYWGIFAGEPLKVVKCETNNIMVPATAEIVLEGEVDPEKRMFEGPFPEMPGYYSGFRMCPAVKINAMTIRNDAIYADMPMGMPPSEGHSLAAFLFEVELFRQLKELVPAVVDVGIVSTQSLTTAVSISKRAKLSTPGLETRVALAAKSVRAGAMIKNVIIVDDDVDVHNVHEVLWAFSVRFQPAKDITVLHDMPGVFLDPSEPWVGHGGKYSGHTSVGLYICTEKPAPYDEGYKRGVALPAKETIERIGDNWAKYGLK
jgi:UbiD family decarboxylase